MRRLNVFIWNTHSRYLYYLTQSAHEFYVPFTWDRKGDYKGRSDNFPWGDNVHDVPIQEVKNLDLDCIIFQSPTQYLNDQWIIFSEEQQHLPKIYLEQEFPADHAAETKHFIDDSNVLIVHVTPFNHLMWDNGRSQTCVIEHGVVLPKNLKYTGELNKGIVIIDHLNQGGRKLGKDIYEQISQEVPIDLAGAGAEEMPGGLPKDKNLTALAAQYRFFFNPVRYAGFPLAICEAMMLGLPIITLATTEVATIIQNGVTGYSNNRVEVLINHMRDLLEDPQKAKELGRNAQQYAQDHFNIQRFIFDWNNALSFCTHLHRYSFYKQGIKEIV